MRLLTLRLVSKKNNDLLYNCLITLLKFWSWQFSIIISFVSILKNSKLFSLIIHLINLVVETSCVLIYNVFVSKFCKLKSDFENLKLVILLLTTFIVSPSYKVKNWILFFIKLLSLHM